MEPEPFLHSPDETSTECRGRHILVHLRPNREVLLGALSSHFMNPTNQSWSLMKLLRLSSVVMTRRATNITLLLFVLFWAACATFSYADPVPTCSLSVTPLGAP